MANDRCPRCLSGDANWKAPMVSVDAKGIETPIECDDVWHSAPLLARQLSREYNFSTQEDRDQAMRMGAELYAAGKSESLPRCTHDPNTCKVGFCDWPKCNGRVGMERSV